MEEKTIPENNENKINNMQSLVRYFRFSSATQAVAKGIQKYKNEKLSSYGLKGMHMTMLCALYKTEEGMTARELIDECGVDKAFVSRVSRELEKLGCVVCVDDTHFKSKYSKRLVLSEKGRQIMDAVDSMLDEAVKKLTDGIPEETLDTFYDVLSVFAGRLNNMCESK